MKMKIVLMSLLTLLYSCSTNDHKGSDLTGGFGECICRLNTGSTYKYCASSITSCNAVCNQMHNPAGIDGAVTFTYSANKTCQTLIQNCEIINARSLGYGNGNLHSFCLSNGWSGGAIPNSDAGSCFRPLNGNTATDCKRLHDYYHNVGGHGCKHLNGDDAAKLAVCGK